MKYTCVNATNGIEYDLKAKNEQEAILEAFDDVTSGFDALSLHDFDQDVINGRTCCHIDKWADDAGDEDDPIASTYIAWDFEFQTDYNTQGNYVLKEIRADLFDDTRLASSDNEDFRIKISNHYH